MDEALSSDSVLLREGSAGVLGHPYGADIPPGANVKMGLTRDSPAPTNCKAYNCQAFLVAKARRA